jgi:hypothetical protein
VLNKIKRVIVIIKDKFIDILIFIR